MCIAAALLLISAALLKAAELLSTSAWPNPVGWSDWLSVLQIGAEMALGIALFKGVCRQVMHWLALCLFIALSSYAFYKATSGATSCGCFGALRVHPWWTFFIDATVSLGLLISLPRPAEDAASVVKGRTKRFGKLLTACVAIIIVLAGVHTVGNTRQFIAVARTANGINVLEPVAWTGKKMPIAEYIDIDMTHGDWTMVFHQHDCPACQSLLPHYERLAKGGQQVALIEVPPYGDRESSVNAVYGRLEDSRQWFVNTPTEVRLYNGVVTAVETFH